MQNIIYFDNPPENFNPFLKVAGCFCEYNGKILLLKRHIEKPQGDRWGLPAGKIEPGEGKLEAAIRETFEETGLKLIENQVISIGAFHFRLPEFDFVFHLFHYLCQEDPGEIFLMPEEHMEALWIEPAAAHALPLMGGADILIRHVYAV